LAIEEIVMKARRQRDAAERLARHMAVAVAVLASVVCSGCGKAGPRNCRISGAVTLDGVPVQEGGIQFDIVKQGDVPGGAVIVGGRYTTWVSPGDKTVRFAIAGSREGLAPEDETPNATPPKYDKEPLKIEVRKNGVFDFPLTSK
jgi:hypothetical protein